jgi:hypothetical protein
MALFPRLGRQNAALGNAAAQQPILSQLQSAQQSQLYALYAQQAQRNMWGSVGLPEPPKFTPSDLYPNTLGWRTWVWDMTANELRSPVQGTTWNGTELRCEGWDETDVVRGVAGIHAHLVPDDWHKLVTPGAPYQGRAYAEFRSGGFRACVAVQGLVERFGRFVLGREGWRAEWVQIRRLAAPTDEIGLALEAAFPEVEIVYGNR